MAGIPAAKMAMEESAVESFNAFKDVITNPLFEPGVFDPTPKPYIVYFL
jgi:hypothetical protein